MLPGVTLRARALSLSALVAVAALGAAFVIGRVVDAPRGPDPSATRGDVARDDVDCSAAALGEDDEYRARTAYPVVDGALGPPCLGERDARLEAAWATLATIAPAEALAPIGLFAGFAFAGESDEVMMAWVNLHDDAGEVFQISLDPDALEGWPEDTRLTMAHELAHVISARPSEVDRGEVALAACRTFSNGAECFRPDSLVHRWVAEFWRDEIGAIEVPDEPAVADGQARCDADAGFFGPYSASTPEEDFAQSFAAHVFGLEPRSDGQRRRLDWMAAEPELAGYRERAEAAGLAQMDYAFEACGGAGGGGAGPAFTVRE